MAIDDQSLEQILELAIDTQFPEERETCIRKALEKLRKTKQESAGAIFLKEETLGDVECFVQVTRSGRFSVVDKRDGDILGHGDSFDQALNRAKASASKKKIRVAVPFITLDGRRGQATGIHARNGTILTKIGGESETLDAYTSVLRADIPSGILDDLAAQTRINKAAQQRIHEIRKEYELNLRKAVKEAIDLVIGENQRKEISDAR